MPQTQSSFLGLKSYQDFWETGPCSSSSPSLLSPVPCQLFPSQMHKIFILSWPEFLKISQQLLKISDDFLKTSERCWNYLKMFRPPLSSSEAISKGKILVCCDTVGHKYFQGNWTALLLLIMCKRTTRVDLRVRHEKFSLMHEIDALGSQAWDLHMRHESWQA